MSKPIGLFDSGIGGLTVMREVMNELSGESFVYFGDTARVPYGAKSKETVTRFSIENTLFLQSFDIRALIVACHTASSLSLSVLQEKFSLPIIGMIEPATKKALSVTKKGRIGVIGTKATIASGAYEYSLKKLDPSVKVFSTACPLFVPLVEEGWVKGEVAEKTARLYLEPLKDFNIDALILGCTHYPMMMDLMGQVMTEKVQLVNPARETALEARQIIERSGGVAKQASAKEEPRFFVSDEPEHFRQMGERFFGSAIGSVVKVSLDASLNTPVET